jgi:hypothetical protein
VQSYYTYTILIIIQHRTRPDQTRPDQQISIISHGGNGRRRKKRNKSPRAPKRSSSRNRRAKVDVGKLFNALLTLRRPPAPLPPVLALRAVPQLGQVLLRLEAEALEMEPLEGALFRGKNNVS